jgi:N-acetylmuramic acid 6-phosphate (MurNAc-6-P) etherase
MIIIQLSERYNMNIEFRYLVAGNDLALIKSQEAAEDDTFQAVADLRNLINSKPYAHIIFIGVTCGLSAPYVGSQINWIMNTPEVSRSYFQELSLNNA